MKSRISLAALTATGVFALSACSGGASATAEPKAPDLVSVEYHASKELPDMEAVRKLASMSASVTVATPTGVSQVDADMPLTNKEGDLGLHMKFAPGNPLTLSVQNSDKWGSVTCKIVVDGVTVSENTSSADYGVASCSGVAR